MSQETSDTLIAVDKSKNLINALRSKMMASHKYIWVLVYNKKNSYELTVANNWGGKLDMKTIAELKQFANDFMADPDNKDLF